MRDITMSKTKQLHLELCSELLSYPRGGYLAREPRKIEQQKNNFKRTCKF